MFYLQTCLVHNRAQTAACELLCSWIVLKYCTDEQDFWSKINKIIKFALVPVILID